MDKNKRRIDSFSLSALQRAQYVTVCPRFHKNGDNRQRITYARGKDQQGMCYIAINIVLRAARLGIPQHYPLAVYKDYKTNTLRFISSNDIRSVLR